MIDHAIIASSASRKAVSTNSDKGGKRVSFLKKGLKNIVK
jgi:hypothetical protein